ncbi:putative DNA modification/repair radical SAM protein [Silvibacterium sp.]|uniref:putative DNA modification/repair radical SAM protein n=1 Tax=Silvibacterium sp. TaxID=1964179 RepID=UPI0039E49979
MTVEQKLAILADAAKYDASCASSGAPRAGNGKGLGHSTGIGICHSYTPDGRCVSLLKILLTNYCTYDCVFCVNRVSSDIRRARFTPAEVIGLTLDFYKRNYIEGLFLSSGIVQSPDYTMEQLIAVARGLREEHAFGGYIHLKAIPGASAALLDQAGTYADRMSANMELPTQQDLVQLAPDKRVGTIEGAMGQIHGRKQELDEDRPRHRATPKFVPAGQSTQMIVGATPSSDRQILETARHLYGRYRLRRIYYSGFSPFPLGDARLPQRPAPLVREHRLYQADWLMRYYGFDARELTTEGEPNLRLDRDPKLTWAEANEDFFPVDVNTASRELLLRVPGIGYRNAERIVSIRRYHRLSYADLTKLHVRMKLAERFVTATDHIPGVRWREDRTEMPSRRGPKPISKPVQMGLFEAGDPAVSAMSGEL